jgi:hypothetical protein
MESCGPMITRTYSKLCVGDNRGESCAAQRPVPVCFKSRTGTARYASALDFNL